MAELTQAQKVWVVTQLACLRKPTEVVSLAAEELGLKVSRQQVAAYDPGTAAGARLSKVLKELFARTRAAYLDDVESVPVAHQAYRLRVLQELLEKHRTDPELVQSVLRQAAGEIGGAFTNRRELSGAAGGPIRVDVDLSSLSDGELDALAALVGKAAGADAGGDRGGGGPAPV